MTSVVIQQSYKEIHSEILTFIKGIGKVPELHGSKYYQIFDMQKLSCENIMLQLSFSAFFF